MSKSRSECVYDDLLEQWKVEVIRARMRKWGFRGLSDDIEQAVVLVLRQFVFDPMNSHGACERTAVTSWIDNTLSMIRRAELRLQARQHRIAAAHPMTHDVGLELSTDVQEAIATLPPFERSVCKLLGQGIKKSKLRTELGCTKEKVAQALRTIRFHFIICGVEEWCFEK